MIGLLQRVSAAQVVVAGHSVGAIHNGLLVLVGVERGDSMVQGERLLERVLNYRVFPDAQGRMNRSLREVQGGLLLVPQFTLAADTRKGLRPCFTPAAAPGLAAQTLHRPGQTLCEPPHRRRLRPTGGAVIALQALSLF